jgi:hypothetical protein
MRGHWKGKVLGVLLSTSILWFPDAAFGAPKTVLLPVTLDYPFIRSVFIHQLYSAPMERAIVMDEAQRDCSRIELWNPEVGQKNSMIKLGSNIKIRTGVPILEKCIGQFEWEGYIEVLQRVTVDQKTWQVRLETIDSHIYNTNRKPATITGNLWNLIKTHVHPFLNQASIDLAPPIEELKAFLPLVFSSAERRRVDRWLSTIRLGKVQVEESAVKINIALEVEISSKPHDTATELSLTEIERFSRAWEDWDAFLVFQIESLIGQPITEAERANLLETLLENRHEFLNALEYETIDQDLVRQQFIWTWQRLTQILRKYLVKQKTLSPLKYLAFFTASDALATLDKLGPTLGLEINRDGLVRLARLLGASETDPTLRYSYSVDPTLRKFLGFGPPLDDSGPILDVEELELPKEPEKNSRPGDPVSWLNHFLFPRAWATEGNAIMLDRVKEWIPPTRNPERYIDKVRNALKGAVDKVLIAHPLPEDHHSFFHLLVLATAWQESCWRQFITQEGKVRYLLSYNQSSVGLMQVNQRVWRGIYRTESLRWNIKYNAEAGIEILEHYLRTYILKNMKPADLPNPDAIARATYVLYNRGPGKLKNFVEQGNVNPLHRTDRLFWEKYTLAKEDQFHQLVHCISGQ